MTCFSNEPSTLLSFWATEDRAYVLYQHAKDTDIGREREDLKLTVEFGIYDEKN